MLALYNFLLKRKYKIPVGSHLLLMLEKFAPRKLPEKLVWEDVDGQRIETPYQVTRLWELDSEILFDPSFEPMLEWAPLMKDELAKAAEAAEMIEQMAAGAKPAPYSPATMAVNLAMHATLRYDRDVLAKFLERVRKKLSLSKEIWQDSWLWQDARTEGIVEGDQRGTQKMIRRALETKFPTELFDGLDRVPPDALEELMVAILRADNPDDARSAIASSIRLQ